MTNVTDKTNQTEFHQYGSAKQFTLTHFGCFSDDELRDSNALKIINGDYEPFLNDPKYYNTLGVFFTWHKMEHSAMDYLKKAFDDGDKNALVNMTNADQENHDEYCIQGIKLGHVESMYQYAWGACESGVDEEEYMFHVEAACVANHAEALGHMGWFLKKRGENEKAIEYFKKALVQGEITVISNLFDMGVDVYEICECIKEYVNGKNIKVVLDKNEKIQIFGNEKFESIWILLEKLVDSPNFIVIRKYKSTK